MYHPIAWRLREHRTIDIEHKTSEKENLKRRTRTREDNLPTKCHNVYPDLKFRDY